MEKDRRTFTRDEIDRVKRENPVEDVVARYVPLRRRGRSLVGLCPFHREKEPSFHVTPAMGRWHCFGACGEGGDVIDFIMRRTGDSFTEAIERLGANRLPPPVPVPTSRLGIGLRGSKELTHDDGRLIRAAAVLYHTAFFLNPQAVRYVTGRGISIPTAQRQMVGYARGDRLVPYLKYKGFSVSRALDLGLLRSVPRINLRHDRLKEFFRGRVIVVEIDGRGNAIHLIGRALDPAVKPKYLSAPGMPKPVYGMACLDPERPVEMVEGPFDYLTLLEWGYQGLAVMGTHLSGRDARRLSQVGEVIITPDADDAGWSAARDWALAIRPDAVLARQCKRSVRFRVLPEGVKDVNDLAQKPGGREVFPNLPLLTLDEATGMADFDPGRPVIVVRSRFDRLILQEWGYQAVCVLGRSIMQKMGAALATAPAVLIVSDAWCMEVGRQAGRDWPGAAGDRARVVSLPDGVKTIREMANGGRAAFHNLVAGWKGTAPVMDMDKWDHP